MTTSQWVDLIKQEFNVSSTVAKNMYHGMLKYYQLHQALEWRWKDDR